VNFVFPALFLVAFVVAALRELFGQPGAMQALSQAMLASARQSVEIVLGMAGIMILFLGLMKIAEKGGLLTMLARWLHPLLIRLFPSIPPAHPAMGSMMMNFSSNLLGLGKSATPFGVRAMTYLEQLNARKGTASDAMILFLAINTSNITLLPTGVIALRATLCSINRAGIVPTTLFASACATLVAVAVAKICAGLGHEPPLAETTDVPHADVPAIPEGYPLWASLTALAGFAAFVFMAMTHGQTIAPWMIPGLATALVGFGLARSLPLYEVFLDGAKEGFEVALSILPYLVAIVVAVGMLRASGALDWLIAPLARLTAPWGMPAEAWLMALLRPLSGSGAYGVMASILADPSIGPDSYTGYLVSTLQGSSETTFYVLAVYFGAIGVKKMRYMLIPALCADLAGVLAAVFACRVLYA
jgi:spore maturation protein SpmA